MLSLMIWWIEIDTLLERRDRVYDRIPLLLSKPNEMYHVLRLTFYKILRNSGIASFDAYAMSMVIKYFDFWFDLMRLIIFISCLSSPPPLHAAHHSLFSVRYAYCFDTSQTDDANKTPKSENANLEEMAWQSTKTYFIATNWHWQLGKLKHLKGINWNVLS